MLDWTDLDLRYTAHAARVARTNREGWLPRPACSDQARRGRQAGPRSAAVRVRIGGTMVRFGGIVVRAGERLGRTPVALASDPTR